jgi:hypothetical protein
MRLVRLMSRILILLLAATALIGLEEVYSRSAYPLTNPRLDAERRHQPSAPEVGYISQFIGYALFLTMCALGGRLVFRMRLNPAPRTDGHPLLLDLHPKR